jgi:hypothetical protein
MPWPSAVRPLIHVLLEWFKKADAAGQVAAIAFLFAVAASFLNNLKQAVRFVVRWARGRREAFHLEARLGEPRDFPDTVGLHGPLVSLHMVNDSREPVQVLGGGFARERKDKAEHWALTFTGVGVAAGLDAFKSFPLSYCERVGVPMTVPVFAYVDGPRRMRVYAKKAVTLATSHR